MDMELRIVLLLAPPLQVVPWVDPVQVLRNHS